jgi:DNA repair exonuclease SbcCD ATPase subunit
MAITFQSLQYKNFLSSGDNPVRIQLNQHSTTLVVGANGAGKSTMIDALSFALFGKPHRDIKNPQLINSVNGKNCEVQIEFSIGSDTYRVIRGYKPSIFEIWKNGQMLNQESHSRDYQKILENNILKMNKRSFNQIVVLGAGNFVPFMQMPIWDRREVIEDLLDIAIFSQMNDGLKERMAKLKEEIRDVTEKITLINERIKLQEKHLNELHDLNAQSEQELVSECQTLESQIHEKQAELKKLDEEYEANQKRVDEELDNARIKMSRFDGFHSQISNNRDRQQKEVDYYEKYRHCQTCDQYIAEEFRQEKLQTGKKKLQELIDGLKHLDEHRENHRLILTATQEEWSRLKKVHIASMTTLASLRGLERRLEDLRNKIKLSAIKADTTPIVQELEASRTEREALIVRKGDLVEERTYQDVAQEMLRDTGIKTKVIKQYVPLMNKCINQYLQILDFFVSFTLNESFEETIRSRHRDDFSYASFSEGEKSRINLAILFTWRQIAKLKNHNSTNLLILDETFDSSLDSDGVDCLLKILNTMTATNVFVITHKPDAMADRMIGKLEFEKNGLFSQLK